MSVKVDIMMILCKLMMLKKPMKFQAKHLGKWVAAKNDKIIAVADSLKTVMNKAQKTGALEDLKFSLVPKGYIAGFNQ